MTKRPNILVFFTDQQRYDSLGCNGNPAARTPNLDALAAAGARLSNHIVANPVCMPSRASLFTGRFPNAHHVWTNGVPLPHTEQTLPQILQGLGYDTAAFGKLHFTPTLAHPGRGTPESKEAWVNGAMDGWHGPYYGFDHVKLTLGHGEMALKVGHYANDVRARFGDLTAHLTAPGKATAIRDSFPSSLPSGAHHSTWVADQTIEYLREERRQDRPFFAFCSFPDPHHPFTPPQPYASMFDGAQLPGPYRGDVAGKPEHYRMSVGVEGNGTRLQAEHDDELRAAMAHTYGMVTLIDHNVGRVLTTLRDVGLDDDTIVVFTSDHGELLGDHWLLRKGPFPCRSLLRVSCLIRVPGTVQPGTVLPNPTSNTDLLPTLVDLAGGIVPGDVQGRSLVSALQGEQPGPETALSMGWSMAWSQPDESYRHLSLFTQRWRLTWFPRIADGELYDLDADPYELVNLYHDPGYAKVRDELQFELLREYVRTEEPALAPISRY